jgi:hypothetical protein
LLAATASVTLLGPLERLHFWHKAPARGGQRGVVLRRETEMADAETAVALEARYTFYPFKSEAIE